MRRGISGRTCEYLGCGYLAESKGKMKDRIVFQVRGVEADKTGNLHPVTLTHIGRAVSADKIAADGKWWTYPGFQKTLELYNIDHVLLDDRAREQATKTGHVLIVEGCFDVAKLIEAGIFNVVASFGAHLDKDQIPRLELIADQLKVDKFLVWYDRDKAGNEGQEKAIKLLQDAGFEGMGFDWDVEFNSEKRGAVSITESVKDVCDFSVEQLGWLDTAPLIHK